MCFVTAAAVVIVYIIIIIIYFQTVRDDTAICSIAGILRECVSPSAGKSRRKAIHQLVAMNASQILVNIIMQPQTITETLLVEELWLLAQVAQRDPKFSIKIRLLGATKTFHSLLRNHYTKVKMLCPILILIKCLTKSAVTTSILVKDGMLPSLEKAFIFIGYTPNLKLKLALSITNQLTKSRLSCIRLAKTGIPLLLLRTFEGWERYDGKSRLKICNHILITLQHLCGTKVGRQYVRKQNALSILHRFGTTCPEDKSYDSLLSRVCHIVNTCMEKRQLPIECLPSPASFNIPKLKTIDSKEFKKDEEKKKKDINQWNPIIPVTSESFYRKMSFESMYSKTLPSDRIMMGSVDGYGYSNRCIPDQHSMVKDLLSIADIHEDSGFRHAYSRIASRIHSVLPFVKIAYPDMMVGESVAFPEQLNVKDRKVCRAKMLACIEYGVKKIESPNSKVVFDLDSLITEFPQTQQVDNKERLLFNLDEAHLGQKQVYKPHLCFESRFESGNLRRVIQVGEAEYDLILMPDVNSSRHHQWFYFQVYNMEQGIPYTFNIINCEKQNSQFNYGMRPLMFSVKESVLGRPGWMRMGTDICYYRNCYRNPTARKPQSYLTMTFTVTFPHSYDICYIAYHYPYTYSQLLAQIWKWSLSVDPSRIYFRAESLCLSLNNNETPLLTISAPETETNLISTRDVVFLTSRVHPGESNSSWVMHGTIGHLLSDAPSAIQLRNKFVFKIVPMLNMEGVINGW
ncbi:hypothetical protein C0J52_18211 [Blattella germanica]|nr:hypothetical protein C0J52_18211 [Blattella germanica]